MGFPACLKKYCNVGSKFQSLIGIYGFSGTNSVTRGHWEAKFQSLIGIYGFSGFVRSSVSVKNGCFNP